MSATLLPCPFCGGAAEFQRIGTGRASCIVGCQDCHCTLESNDSGERNGDTWNFRDGKCHCRDCEKERDSDAEAQGAAEATARALAAIDAEVEYQCSLVKEHDNEFADCAMAVLGRVRDHIKQETKPNE